MLNIPDNGAVLAALFIAMLALLEVGRRVGRRRLAADPAGANSGMGAIESAVFALLGLMLAFTFSGAASRFDARRELIVRETGAIDTAWLRLSLLPEPAQADLRADFRAYVDARLAATRLGSPEAGATVARLEREIWARAVESTRPPGLSTAASLLLPALNDMFNLVTARGLAMNTHAPWAVFAMVLVLTLACSLLAGRGMAASRERSWLHLLCFAGTLLMAICVIWDLEFPRSGFIRIDHADRPLIELRAEME